MKSPLNIKVWLEAKEWFNGELGSACLDPLLWCDFFWARGGTLLNGDLRTCIRGRSVRLYGLLQGAVAERILVSLLPLRAEDRKRSESPSQCVLDTSSLRRYVPNPLIVENQSFPKPVWMLSSIHLYGYITICYTYIQLSIYSHWSFRIEKESKS